MHMSFMVLLDKFSAAMRGVSSCMVNAPIVFLPIVFLLAAETVFRTIVILFFRQL
jgi:hypothetical protein